MEAIDGVATSEESFMDQHDFSDIGHRVIELLADYLEGIESRPVAPIAEPVELNKLFAESLPRGRTQPHVAALRGAGRRQPSVQIRR
jgi:hypothetical protein